MKIYALKDNKLGYMQPFAIQNDELAIRSYKNLITSGNSMVSSNKEDFDLYCLGSYDQDSGVITSDIRFICNHLIINE